MQNERKERASPVKAWQEYEKCLAFNQSINLDDTVEVNENFFIGS